MYRLILVACLGVAPLISRASDIDFAHDVQPILSKRCAKCHSGTQRKGGLSINSRQSLLNGGESGRVVHVGKSGDSPLIARIAATDAAQRMPPEGEPLTKPQIEMLRRWIDAGLPWEDGFSFGKTFTRAPIAPRRPDVPSGDAEKSGANPIDRFLHARLSSLDPHLVNDRAFARRAFLDLIGLLPTPKELDEFASDASPNKREKIGRAHV